MDQRYEYQAFGLSHLGASAHPMPWVCLRGKMGTYAHRKGEPNMDDLTQKPCRCGGVATEVIKLNRRSTDDTLQPYRSGWECLDCKASEKAIGRETWIDTKRFNNL